MYSSRNFSLAINVKLLNPRQIIIPEWPRSSNRKEIRNQEHFVSSHVARINFG